jgi:RND family efflux transporter MFP subunit
MDARPTITLSANQHGTLAWTLLLGLTSLWLAGCEPAAGTGDAAPGERRTPVRVAEVRIADAQRELRLPGAVRATRRTEPAFLQAGYLAERYVARGARVTAGQRLAALQNPALAPAVAGAEARVRELDERLVNLEAEYQRARELHARGLASAERLDRALAERNAARESRAQAQAQVEEAREQLADAVLRAPFDAQVSEVLAEPGDFVAAGQPVLVLAGSDALEIELHLPEGLAPGLRPGDAVDVRAVGSGLRTTGRLREIGVARPGQPAAAIVALEDAAAWEPGAAVHVDLLQQSSSALLVPLAAIVDPGTGQARVFRVVDGRAVLTPVRVGRLAGSAVEVGGALAAGELVVVAGHHQLLDGEAVRILP